MRSVALLALWVFLSSSVVWRGTTHRDFTAEIELSASQLKVTDGLDLTLRLSAPEGYHIDLFSIREGVENAQEGITVESEVVGRTLHIEGGMTIQEIHYRLEPWVEGDGMIAFLPLRWISERGDGIELNTAPLLFHVAHDETGIEAEDLVAGLLPLEIKPQLSLSRENREQLALASESERQRRDALRAKRRFPWMVMGAILLFAALFWAGSRLRFNRSGKSRIEPVDPRSHALRLLEQLQSEDLPAKQLFDPFYVRLTEIVRRYIEQVFELRAPEQTTQEFLQELVEKGRFDSAMEQLLTAFLTEADLVKFAKLMPTGSQCQGAVEAARQVIDYSAQ